MKAGTGHITGASETHWQGTRRRFRSNRLARTAWGILLFLVFVAVFADFIACNKPWVAKYKGEWHFPIVQDYLSGLGWYQWEGELIHANWKELELESAWWPPVRYYPYGDMDYRNFSSVSPFGDQQVAHWKLWHLLGTDNSGRDVLACIVHGTRTSLTVGIVAMGIAALIGILLGGVAGFYGDNTLRLSRIQMFLGAAGILPALFYGFFARSYILQDALNSGTVDFALQLCTSLIIFIAVIAVFMMTGKLFRNVPWLGDKKYVWADMLISRFTEVVITLPILLVLITLVSVMEEGSLSIVVLIVGLSSWPSVARLVRGELLRTRSLDFIQSARALGMSNRRILFRHALPNSLSPALVAITFGIASAILLESSLSFLGLSGNANSVTWGYLLNLAREDISSWWLTLFPGLTIFITVAAFNLAGEGLRDALDPKTGGL